MRLRPWHNLIIVILITVVAGWISLPGDSWDLGNYRENHPVRLGLDLQGGLQVTLEARPPEGVSVDSRLLDGTRDTLERRVNALGVSEPLVQTRGNDQIVVELPGVEDPDTAIEVLQDTALLEIIDTRGTFLQPGTVVTTSLGGPSETGATPEASPAAGSEQQPSSDDTVYETIISGSDLTDAFVTTTQTGQVAVAFELTNDAGRTFHEYTSTHLGAPMSILIDKTVISSPQISAAISTSGVIEGVNAQEAETLALQLRAGALGVPMEVVSSRTIGPSLGQASIDQSLVAGSVGLAAVCLFMILFYRIPGVISVIALLIYAALTFALFRIIPVTLTLAGIAGFILSIGMAVDASVLIFARLKEELRAGRPLDTAVDAGFDHAWPSIRDSEVATMITCVILYWFGQFTGATMITGFALTLFVGVAVSMFTAIFVSRTLLHVAISTRWSPGYWWLGLDRDEEPGAKGGSSVPSAGADA
ncbi:MAG TPA: protein translocase subunit SecD [Thermomicrobiales bacterium]|nr:protein translocase subunit SecD [Thermomicrobiales bacterium]